MTGEVFTEPAVAALGDETLESGDKVEEVTKRFPFLRYSFLFLFFSGWGIISLVLLIPCHRHNLQEDRMAR